MESLNNSDPKRPKALKTGDTIGIAAPASPFDRQSFDAGLAVLESMGFHLAIPDDIFENNGYLAGMDRQRAEQVTRLFVDPDIDGIVCARGGYGSMRILPFLEPDVLANHPKVFIGFSDITALLARLVHRCRLVAFHGPSVTTLASGDPVTREFFLKTLTIREPLTFVAQRARVLQPGRAAGPFFCGNLTVLCHLTGTGFQPDLARHILLLEDRGEAPYRIDRMLTQMRQAGCFKGLAGLALGNFTDCGPLDEIQGIVADRMGGLDIPILAGFDVGHEAVNLTLPVGVPATLETASQSLAFHTPAVV